jgi:hypothetical protein
VPRRDWGFRGVCLEARAHIDEIFQLKKILRVVAKKAVVGVRRGVEIQRDMGMGVE